MSRDVAKRPRARRKARIAGPKPAPGPLEVVQAFVNTKDLKHGTDELSNPWELSCWLSSRQLLPEATHLTQADLNRALEVREGLHALLAAHAGFKLDPSAVASMASAVRGARLEISIVADGTVRLGPASPGLVDAFGVLLANIAESQHLGTWPRLKVCANKECRAAFYDTRDVGKWCCRLCGDLMRSRSYRRSGKKYRHAGSNYDLEAATAWARSVLATAESRKGDGTPSEP